MWKEMGKPHKKYHASKEEQWQAISDKMNSNGNAVAEQVQAILNDCIAAQCCALLHLFSVAHHVLMLVFALPCSQADCCEARRREQESWQE